MTPFSTFKQAHSVLLIVLALSERLKLNIFFIFIATLSFSLVLSFTSHRSFSVFVALSLQHARTHTNVKRTSSSLTYVPFFLGRSTHTHALTQRHSYTHTLTHTQAATHTTFKKCIAGEFKTARKKF